MARFYGAIGYGETVETAEDGVYADQIVEYMYYGDLVRNTRYLQAGEYLNNDISTGHSISIIADAYANKNFLNIRYAEWSGTRWAVSFIDVTSPRLILRLGGVYNGPGPIQTEPTPDDSGADSGQS